MVGSTVVNTSRFSGISFTRIGGQIILDMVGGLGSFVNGQLVQEGDLFDSSTRVILSHHAIPGESFFISLRLVSPGHDEGALVRSQLICEAENTIDPGYFADELAVVKIYLGTRNPEAIEILETAVNTIDWLSVSDREKFDKSLQVAASKSG